MFDHPYPQPSLTVLQVATVAFMVSTVAIAFWKGVGLLIGVLVGVIFG